MTPNDIDTEYEQWKADAEPTFDGKPTEQDEQPMSVDECIAALNVAEYTATADEPFPRTFHLADDAAFQRLVELARGRTR